MKILDCTLRDGGYYTDWHFAGELVENYLNAMSGCGVDIVEIGFRSPRSDQFFGPYIYSSDEFLKTLPLPKNLEIAVMINAKDFIEIEGINSELIDAHFSKSSESLVDLVRIAAHYREIPALSALVNKLVDKGYKVAINLMQTGEKSLEEISQAAEALRTLDLEVLYFADSLGNMGEHNISQTVQAITTHWKGAVGMHAHNNMGNALHNCQLARKSGVSYFDGTVLGMGRGAGNVQTEYLLIEFSKEIHKYCPESIFPLVLKDFSELQKRYQWGPSLLYYLSAQYKIHPTYVQEVLMTNNTTTNIINALDNLKKDNSTSYNKERLNNALKLDHKDAEGNWDCTQFFMGKDLLIIGSGPSIKEHKEAIELYIRTEKPVVISLNINDSIDENCISAYAACHPIKLHSDIERYRFLNRPILLPLGSLNPELQGKVKGLDCFNYGLKISRSSFEFAPTECCVPVPLVFGYVISAATAGGANRILVAGLDGYPKGDDRQNEMETLLDCYRNNEQAKEIIAVTKTTYSIKQATIYSPSL